MAPIPVNIFLNFHLCIPPARSSFWTWEERCDGIKKVSWWRNLLPHPTALRGFGIDCTSLDFTWEIYAISPPTNGNASAGICSFLRYQKQSTMRHKHKWNQLCQPWNCLLWKPKKMHFKGIISLPESSQTGTGCWDYWAAFRHKPQSILRHFV